MNALGHLFVKYCLLLPTVLLAADGSTKPGCSADGRYWMHHDRGEKIYCFDGESYPEGDLPKHVKEFFEPPPPKKQPSGNAGPDGASPIGSESSKPALTRKGSAGPGGGSASGKDAAGIDWDMGKKMAGAGDPAAGVASNAGASGAPALLDPGQIQEIQIGMGRKAVVAKLGKPHGAVMNVSVDGIVQILNYVTTEGTAAVHLLEGRVVAVRRPRT
jgi:hypothetical protein